MSQYGKTYPSDHSIHSDSEASPTGRGVFVSSSTIMQNMEDSMTAAMRAYQKEEDYWCIREFLREASVLNHRHDFAWSLLRWDYWRWHVNENTFHFQLQDVIMLWE